MPGIMMSLLIGKSIPSGSLTRTTTGTFVVPAYNTMTVVCSGSKGAASADGFAGGLGGRATRTYINGSGGPAVGASITIYINAGPFNDTTFYFGTAPVSYNGENGVETVPEHIYTSGGDDTLIPEAPGRAGEPGTAYNGSTNETGVSTTQQCVITWS